MNEKQQAKVAWFKHRTGCDDTEAEKYLKEAKFKINEALELRKANWKRLYLIEQKRHERSSVPELSQASYSDEHRAAL